MMLTLVLRAVVVLLAGLLVMTTAVSGTGSASAAIAGFDTPAQAGWDLNNGLLSMAMTPTGVLYLSGWFTKIGAPGSARVSRNAMAAVDTRSGAILSWHPNPNNSAESLAPSADGQVVYATGQFTRIGGARRPGIAALDAGSGLATKWTPPRLKWGQNAITVAPDGTRVYEGGGSGVAALDPRTAHIMWRSKPGGTTTLELSPDGSTLFANWQKGNESLLIALRSRDGRVLWRTKTDGIIYALEVSDDGHTLYIGGHFDSVAGARRRNVAAVDAVTGRTTTWAPKPSGYIALPDDESVSALGLGERSRVVYIGGSFTRVDGKHRVGIAGVDAESGRVLAWNPANRGVLGAIALSPNRRTVYFADFVSAGHWRLKAVHAATG